MGWKGLFKDAGPKPEDSPAKPIEEKILDPITVVTETNLFEKTRSGRGSKPKPVTRTAMGEYIVPPGGKPLTVLANPDVPGPASYLPKIALTKPCAPQYSLKGRYKQPEEDKRPGPADYQVDHGLLWQKKTLKLKGREHEINFAEPGASDLGPAGYHIEYDTVGKGRPKYSIKGRKPLNLYTGPPTFMYQAIDTGAFETPGPNYRPGSSDWRDGPQKSFGAPLSHNYLLNQLPVGPADYDLSSVPAWDGPAYSLAKRLPYPSGGVGEKRPGPNEYDLGTTVGKCEGASMTSRRETSQPYETPAPNSYTLKDTVDLNAKAASLTYRWYKGDKIEDEPSTLPGPGHYDIPVDTVGGGPAFTFRPRLDRRYRCTAGDGPAKYDIRKNFAENDKPAFSMGKRLKDVKKDNTDPGPGQYDVKDRPEMKKAPEFSFAKLLPRSLRTSGPGPAQYKPKLMDGGPMYTMTRRPASLKGKKKSSPGPYRLPEGATRWGRQVGGGVTFKSRASPYVYSGFKTNKFFEPMAPL